MPVELTPQKCSLSIEIVFTANLAMRVFLNLHFSVYNTSWCVNARQRNAPSLVLANILQARPMTRLSLLTQQPLMFAIKILFHLFHRSLHISYTDVCAHCALQAPAWILVCKQKQKLVFAFISLKAALYVTMFKHRTSTQLYQNNYIFFRKNQIKICLSKCKAIIRCNWISVSLKPQNYCGSKQTKKGFYR